MWPKLISSSFCLVCSQLPKCLARNVTTTSARLGTFEPDYLDKVQYKPGIYPLMNIQIKGYDYHVLESYQSFIDRSAKNIGLDVSESWITPCESFVAKTYLPGSTTVKDAIPINIYERNVQIVNMPSIDIPILIDILRRTIPEGVDLSFHEHTAEHFEARFIPDPFLNSVKKELEEIEAERLRQREISAASKEAKDAAKEQRKLGQLYEDMDDDDDF